MLRKIFRGVRTGSRGFREYRNGSIRIRPSSQLVMLARDVVETGVVPFFGAFWGEAASFFCCRIARCLLLLIKKHRYRNFWGIPQSKADLGVEFKDSESELLIQYHKELSKIFFAGKAERRENETVRYHRLRL